MTAFEDFVNRELPQRPVLLQYSNTSYDGNPNDAGAPSILQSAPLGTFFHEQSTKRLWRKKSSTSGSWAGVDSSTQPRSTITDITITVDYNDANAITSIPADIIFDSQETIDGFLASQGKTTFKYVQDIIDALPYFIMHRVTINMAAGLHRPRAGDNYIINQIKPCIGGEDTWPTSIGGGVIIQGSSSYDYEPGLSGLAVQSEVATSVPSLTFAGTPFAGLTLDGLYVVLSTGQIGLISSHTDDTLYLRKNISPTAVGGTASIGRPSTVLRATIDDSTKLWWAIRNNGASRLVLNDIEVQDFWATISILSYGENGSLKANRVLIDVDKQLVDIPGMSVSGYCRYFQVQGFGGYLSLDTVSIRANTITNNSSTAIYIYGSGFRCNISYSHFWGNIGTLLFDGSDIDIKVYSSSFRIASQVLDYEYSILALEGANCFLAMLAYSGAPNEFEDLGTLGGPCIRLNNYSTYSNWSTATRVEILNTSGPFIRAKRGAFIDMFEDPNGTYNGTTGDVGIDVVGPFAVVHLDPAVNISGVNGETRIDGVVGPNTDIGDINNPISSIHHNFVYRG